MRLCLEMGLGLDVDAALNTVTPEQFDEWVALDRIEPIGEPRRDARIALLGAHVCGSLGAKDIELEDFLPWMAEDDEVDEVDDELEALKQIERIRFAVGIHNAAVLNSRKG